MVTVVNDFPAGTTLSKYNGNYEHVGRDNQGNDVFKFKNPEGTPEDQLLQVWLQEVGGQKLYSVDMS